MSRGRKIRGKVSKYQSCDRKVMKFKSKEEAQRAAADFMEAKPWSLPKVAYRCPWDSSHWHYGSPMGR